MLTVVVGLDESGNNKNRRPFGNVYSVMPSTVGPLVALTGGAFWAAGCCAGTPLARATIAAARASGRRERIWFGMIGSSGESGRCSTIAVTPFTAAMHNAAVSAAAQGRELRIPVDSHQHLRTLAQGVFEVCFAVETDELHGERRVQHVEAGEARAGGGIQQPGVVRIDLVERCSPGTGDDVVHPVDRLEELERMAVARGVQV